MARSNYSFDLAALASRTDDYTAKLMACKLYALTLADVRDIHSVVSVESKLDLFRTREEASRRFS